MRLPIRKSQQLKDRDDEEVVLLTQGAVDRTRRELEDLETSQRPQAVQDVSEAVAKGDLSENAEYQEAKSRLARIDGRIFSLKDRLKRVSIIQKTGTHTVQLGSTVVVSVNGKEKTYSIVGPRESNPTHGRISHVSPIGSALIGHSVGEWVNVETPNGATTYHIEKIS
jgi:transcription elongation factor GreA